MSANVEPSSFICDEGLSQPPCLCDLTFTPSGRIRVVRSPCPACVADPNRAARKARVRGARRCRGCGTQGTNHYSSSFCQSCASKRVLEWVGRRSGKLPPLPERRGSCQDCSGVVTVPKRGAVPIRCQGCEKAYQKQQAQLRPPHRELACRQCGVVFWRKGEQSFCSQSCASKSQVTPVGADRVCAECSVTFTPIRVNARFCSRKCCKAFADRIRAEKRRLGVLRRSGERHRLYIFIRDGWKCQHCGVNTKKYYKKKHPRSPEVDHIHPLSRGGEHSYRNTQCSCRTCNIKKGDKLLGQLRLFG